MEPRNIQPQANCPRTADLQTAILVQYFNRPDEIGTVIAVRPPKFAPTRSSVSLS